jgi:hypothetical protein
MGGGMGGGYGGAFGGGGAGGASLAGGGMMGGAMMGPGDPSADLDASQGVVAQATTSEIGEQFQYSIAHPVTLASRRSAMIPIVDQNIQAEKLSIFTAGEDNQHPMLASRLTNTTELRLAGGPITVFDAGAYAGDARIEYFRPGERRLVSFAQDVDL